MAGGHRRLDPSEARAGGKRRAAALDPPSRTPADEAAVRALLGLELASVRASAAFRDWIVEIHARAGGPPLRPRELLLLHAVLASERAQSLSELRRFTNARGLPALRSALAQLCAAGLLRSTGGRASRDPTYAVTAKGSRLARRCDALRDAALVTLCRGERGLMENMSVATTVVERLVAIYGQATRYVADLRVLDGSNPYTRDSA